MRSELWERFVKVRKCVACDEILAWAPERGAFCPECLSEWEFAKVQSCPDCFQSAIECRCMPRLLSKSGALCLRKFFFYDSGKQGKVPSRLIFFIKRKRSRRVLRFLAKELWAVLSDELKAADIEPSDESLALVSLPRGWTARSAYGFDQSEWICRTLSDLSGIAYLPLIRRRLGGSKQKTLNRAQRLKNMKKRFVLRERFLQKEQIDLSKRTVILVDDLVTSGTTMSVAVSVLHRAGVKRIFCLSLGSKP